MNSLSLEDKVVLLKAIDTWGVNGQVDMAYEELGEVITAINQFKRRRITAEDFASEIADAIIMLNQLELTFGLAPHVDEAIRFKMDRLEKRIDKSQKEMLGQV